MYCYRQHAFWHSAEKTHSLISTFRGVLLQLGHAIFIDVEYSIVHKSELVGWTAREEQKNQ